MQLSGVNSPTQRLIVYSDVTNETQPDIVKLRPMSQSKMQVEFGAMFFIYSDKVDLPVFFFPKIRRELLDFSKVWSNVEKGAFVGVNINCYFEISRH